MPQSRFATPPATLRLAERAEDTRPYLGVDRQEAGRQLDLYRLLLYSNRDADSNVLFDLAIIIGRHRDARVSELLAGNNWQIIESYLLFYRTT